LHLGQDLALNSPVLLALRGINLATLDAHFRVIDA
jgi:hypothetical protein